MDNSLSIRVDESHAEQDHIRELISQNYRIIYLIRPDHLYIVTVIHGNRDLTQGETKPWEMV